MNDYIWEITIVGHGATPKEAWEDATEGVVEGICGGHWPYDPRDECKIVENSKIKEDE